MIKCLPGDWVFGNGNNPRICIHPELTRDFSGCKTDRIAMIEDEIKQFQQYVTNGRTPRYNEFDNYRVLQSGSSSSLYIDKIINEKIDLTKKIPFVWLQHNYNVEAVSELLSCSINAAKQIAEAVHEVDSRLSKADKFLGIATKVYYGNFSRLNFVPIKKNKDLYPSLNIKKAIISDFITFGSYKKNKEIPRKIRKTKKKLKILEFMRNEVFSERSLPIAVKIEKL